MDFFALQQKAQAQTKYLVFLFVVAVVLILLALNGIAYLAMNANVENPMTLTSWLEEPYWLTVTIVTSLLIFITSMFRSYQLRSTPDAIAKMVNATPVSLHSNSIHQNAKEKRLINVVEEISIASGVPIPKIYIMKQEQGINAFVAGLETKNVTLVVTQGLLDNLTRDELQGVIAHEYSHIFHGDMRINVKLIGILAGILVIGQLGQLMLRLGSGSNNKKDGGLPIAAIGLGLLCVGYIGLFFGRLIKAAISRQREFLADASAVQYTRNKEGICRALYKILLNQHGSLLVSDKAEEMSHLCFGESVKIGFSGMLATHPPLGKRISAIDPRFDFANKMKKNSNNDMWQKAQSELHSNFASSNFSTQTSASSDISAPDVASSGFEPNNIESNNIESNSVLNSVGSLTTEQISEAQLQLAEVPPELLAIARAESIDADEKDFILGLLIANQENAADYSIIQERNYELEKIIIPLSKKLSNISFKKQHLLFEIALARLEEKDEKDNREFINLLSRIVNKDDAISLSEFMIYASCARRTFKPDDEDNQVSRFKKIEPQIGNFIALLFLQSEHSFSEKQLEYVKVLRLLGLKERKLGDFNFSVQELGRDLNQIGKLHPLLKKDFIQLSLDIIQNDGIISQKEYEIIRLLGEYLDCPFPIKIH